MKTIIVQVFRGRGLRPLTILLLLLLIHWLLPLSAHALLPSSSSPPPISITVRPSSSNTGFIRTSCGDTLYPDLCYRSLSGYASTVQSDPGALSRIAITLTLFRAQSLLANLSSASSSSSSSSSKDALHDCISVMGDAVAQIRGSLKQMRRLVINSTTTVHVRDHHQDYSALRLGLNDVQTWMSAALTNEDTCTEGLLEEERSNNSHMHMHLIEQLCYRATTLNHLTSNALALLNAYVARVDALSPPPPVPP